MAVVWMVEDDAEGVLRQRRAFRDAVVALAEPLSDVDAAELIYGELVANTVRYAGQGAVEVRLEVDDSLPAVLIVRDHGPGLRSSATATWRDPYAESGRGLGIVELLARGLRVERAEGGGTIVTAVLPLRQPDGGCGVTERAIA